MLPGGPGFRFAAEVCSVERAERVLVSLIRDPEKDVSFCLIRLQGSLKVFASEAAAEAWFANTLRIDFTMTAAAASQVPLFRRWNQSPTILLVFLKASGEDRMQIIRIDSNA